MVHSVEGASLGIWVPSLHVFVEFDPQVEPDVEVLDGGKCEQAVSGADKHCLSDGRDACQDETVVLQVVYKEGERSQQV